MYELIQIKKDDKTSPACMSALPACVQEESSSAAQAVAKKQGSKVADQLKQAAKTKSEMLAKKAQVRRILNVEPEWRRSIRCQYQRHIVILK